MIDFSRRKLESDVIVDSQEPGAAEVGAWKTSNSIPT